MHTTCSLIAQIANVSFIFKQYKNNACYGSGTFAERNGPLKKQPLAIVARVPYVQTVQQSADKVFHCTFQCKAFNVEGIKRQHIFITNSTLNKKLCHYMFGNHISKYTIKTKILQVMVQCPFTFVIFPIRQHFCVEME